MKIKPLLLAGLAGYTSYQLYQKRQLLKQAISQGMDRLEEIQFDVANIQENLAIIQQQADLIKDYKQDLTYKFRVLDQEAKGHLAEINQRAQKWSQTKEES